MPAWQAVATDDSELPRPEGLPVRHLTCMLLLWFWSAAPAFTHTPGACLAASSAHVPCAQATQLSFRCRLPPAEPNTLAPIAGLAASSAQVLDVQAAGSSLLSRLVVT